MLLGLDLLMSENVWKEMMVDVKLGRKYEKDVNQTVTQAESCFFME